MPGIKPNGEMEAWGIPASILTAFLDARRVEIARTGDYTILTLFSVSAPCARSRARFRRTRRRGRERARSDRIRARAYETRWRREMLAAASAVLGRPHSLSGVVVHGDCARPHARVSDGQSGADRSRCCPLTAFTPSPRARRDDDGAPVPLRGSTRPVHGVMSIGVRPTIWARATGRQKGGLRIGHEYVLVKMGSVLGTWQFNPKKDDGKCVQKSIDLLIYSIKPAIP